MILWGGLGAGRKVGDTHVEGWALDFHGAETPSGSFDVHRDWGLQPVPASIGGYKGRWPADATKTSYRLAASPLDMGKFHPQQMAAPDFVAEDAISFWDTTNREDWRISEMSQARIRSRAYTPGPYSKREALLHAFDQYVVRRVGL